MCSQKNLKNQHRQQINSPTSEIDKDSKFSKPPKHSKDVHLLRRQKLHLSGTLALLFGAALQFFEEEKENTRRNDQEYRAADMQSFGLYARKLDHTQGSQARKCYLPLRTLTPIKGLVKICDFGWSISTNIMRDTFCGTPLYVSPEILKRKTYNNKIDVWSIGILTY